MIWDAGSSLEHLVRPFTKGLPSSTTTLPRLVVGHHSCTLGLWFLTARPNLFGAPSPPRLCEGGSRRLPAYRHLSTVPACLPQLGGRRSSRPDAARPRRRPRPTPLSASGASPCWARPRPVRRTFVTAQNRCRTRAGCRSCDRKNPPEGPASRP